MTAQPDPFAALGLPARPDLSDEQVRAAWRAIAAATHPDRPGGGNPAAYAAASAAYATLRTAWGRSEAYADLMAATAPSAIRRARAGPARPGAHAARTLLLVPARIRHGRPWHLALRILAAVILAVIAARSGAGGPAAAGVISRAGGVGRAYRAGGSRPAPGTVSTAVVPGVRAMGRGGWFFNHLAWAGPLRAGGQAELKAARRNARPPHRARVWPPALPPHARTPVKQPPAAPVRTMAGHHPVNPFPRPGMRTCPGITRTPADSKTAGRKRVRSWNRNQEKARENRKNTPGIYRPIFHGEPFTAIIGMEWKTSAG